jgi:acyl carrier protein
MFEKLAKIVTLETGCEHVMPETRLDELGIDSLELLGLLLAVESGFGVTVPQEKIPTLETVGDIAAAIA